MTYRRFAVVGGILILTLAAFVFITLHSRKVELLAGASLPPLVSVSPQVEEAAPTSTPSPASPPPYRGAGVDVLNADPVFLKQVPKDYYEKSKRELADLAVKLAENPNQPQLWMRVASVKHFYNDDAGAADAYEYMNRISSDPVGYYNLALVYGYNLKQPQKAIPKFESALKYNPWNTSFYIGFANFYREVLNDLPAAEKVLLEGETKVPAEVGLYAALGSLYKAMADTTKAIVYYEKALAMRDLSRGEREALAAEIERLKNQR